jgi:hypothetical protein
MRIPLPIRGERVKSIGKVTLGLDETARVLVKSNVLMKDVSDRDDLYFVMFNIMAPDEDKPLRLSVATVGDFAASLQALGYIEAPEVQNLINNDPERYLGLVGQHYGELVTTGSEKVSIPLDSQPNADKARAVLASLIENKCYVQVTRYRIPGGDPEIVERAQEVPTEELIPSLKTMLGIVKDWKNFDMEAYQ